jgi:hypothetical protein
MSPRARPIALRHSNVAQNTAHSHLRLPFPYLPNTNILIFYSTLAISTTCHAIKKLLILPPELFVRLV